MRRPPLLSWREDWPLFVAWPAIGLLTVILTATALMLASQPVPWMLLVWSMMSWAQWILLMPLIVAVARRWRIGASPVPNVVAAHFASFIVAWLGHSALVYLWRYLLFGRWVITPGISVREDLSVRLPTWLLYDALIYLTTVAGASALELHRRLRERAVRQAQLEARVAEAELELMRMQVQPAFILRTLASARTHLMKSPRRAEVMITRLSEVLRGSLESLGHDRVRLEGELQHIRSWIAVESLRADRAIELEIDCDAEAMEQQVPKYLISEVISEVVDATPVDETVRALIVAAEVGGLLAVRVAVEGSGCSLVRVEALKQLERRLNAASGDGWSLTVEESSDERIALSIDRSPADYVEPEGLADLHRSPQELAIEL